MIRGGCMFRSEGDGKEDRTKLIVLYERIGDLGLKGALRAPLVRFCDLDWPQAGPRDSCDDDQERSGGLICDTGQRSARH